MLALGLLLAGCRAQGQLSVQSADVIEVDVTVSDARRGDCSSDLAGLTATPVRDARGVVTSCRYEGTISGRQFGWAASVVGAGEYLVLAAYPVETFGFDSVAESGLDAVDLTVVFPGQIVESNGGTASGNELRITDPTAFEADGGLRTVALSHPGPPLWVWWLTGGVLLGVVASLGVLRWGRRRDLPLESVAPDDAEEARRETDVETPDADVGVSGPPVDAPDPSPETRAAVVATPDAADADPGGLDDSPFRRPAYPEPPASRPRQDPSRWAPDDDR